MLPRPLIREPGVDMLGERYDQWVMPDWVKEPHKMSMEQAHIESVQRMTLERRPISEEARRLADHALNLQQDGNYELAGEYMIQAIERAQQDAVSSLIQSVTENIKWMTGTTKKDVNKTTLLSYLDIEEERG
jgi:hypothetical protein